MSASIRYPNINAASEKEQIAQIRSYLHQLVDQLNYALPNAGSGDDSKANNSTYSVQGQEMSYYELRSLIIKNLQEVQKIAGDLEADFVKKSGWKPDRYLVTNDNGIVVSASITFAIDEDGNLYYEVEE